MSGNIFFSLKRERELGCKRNFIVYYSTKIIFSLQLWNGIHSLYVGRANTKVSIAITKAIILKGGKCCRAQTWPLAGDLNWPQVSSFPTLIRATVSTCVALYPRLFYSALSAVDWIASGHLSSLSFFLFSCHQVRVINENLIIVTLIIVIVIRIVQCQSAHNNGHKKMRFTVQIVAAKNAYPLPSRPPRPEYRATTGAEYRSPHTTCTIGRTQRYIHEPTMPTQGMHQSSLTS